MRYPPPRNRSGGPYPIRLTHMRGMIQIIIEVILQLVQTAFSIASAIANRDWMSLISSITGAVLTVLCLLARIIRHHDISPQHKSGRHSRTRHDRHRSERL